MPEEFRIKGAARRASLASQQSKTPSEDGEIEEDETENPPLPDEAPPLPDEQPPLADDQPPLPDQAPPATEGQDDGWDARYDPASGAWYFANRFTGMSQWENPRVPSATYGNTGALLGPPPSTAGAPGTSSVVGNTSSPAAGPYLGYNPRIHGDYDPNADYAKYHEQPAQDESTTDTAAAETMIGAYAQQATFNRFTGAFQSGDKNPEHHNDENKSRRQMNAFFDVDRAATLV